MKQQQRLQDSMAALQMVGMLQEMQDGEGQRELARRQAEASIQGAQNQNALFPLQQQMMQQELAQQQKNPNLDLQRLLIPSLSQTVGQDPMTGKADAQLLLDYLAQQGLFQPSQPTAPPANDWISKTFNQAQ